jgi:DNA-binding CsgD family transcriptional regulator
VDKRILLLIGLLYDAASNEEYWPVFLSEIKKALGTTANVLFVQNLQNQGIIGIADEGFEESFLQSYVEYYQSKNVYLIRGREKLLPNKAYLSSSLCPDEELIKSEFYNDWAHPQRLGQSIVGTVLTREPCVGLIELIRPEGAEDFEADQVEMVRILLPHLRRALFLHCQKIELKAQNTAAARALDLWPLGLVLVDSKGKVILANQKARTILDKKDGLLLKPDGLQAASLKDTRRLNLAIQSAICALRLPGSFKDGVVHLPRPSLKPPLEIMVTPLSRGEGFFADGNGAAAILINDPAINPNISKKSLAQGYGLTPTETTLTSMLLEGKDTREAADELGVGMNSIRFHLKNIFDKTMTRRQAELIRLILSSPFNIEGNRSDD